MAGHRPPLPSASYQLAAMESGEKRGSPVTAPVLTNSICPIVKVCSWLMVLASQPALGSPCTKKSEPMSDTYRP